MNADRSSFPQLARMPEPGFYYHYKHDPAGPYNGYAYEVMGVGHHTEDYPEDKDKFMVVYRPLYEAFVYKLGKLFDIRPLGMFMEDVDKPEYKGPRFIKITDEAIIEKLRALRGTMYP